MPHDTRDFPGDSNWTGFPVMCGPSSESRNHIKLFLDNLMPGPRSQLSDLLKKRRQKPFIKLTIDSLFLQQHSDRKGLAQS